MQYRRWRFDSLVPEEICRIFTKRHRERHWEWHDFNLDHRGPPKEEEYQRDAMLTGNPMGIGHASGELCILCRLQCLHIPHDNSQ